MNDFTTATADDEETLLNRLRARGWRITAQRRVVSEVLNGNNVHLTADEVLSRAAVELPEISKATVYNTLNEMVELGEVLELSLDGRSKRYDPNVAPFHHHLLCDTCGVIYDVLAGFEPPELPDHDRHGMQVKVGRISYRGTCADCAIHS